MKDATLVSVALFALATHAFQMDLYYRNKGRFREKRYIAYADLSVSEEHHLVARISFGTPAQEFCVVLDTSQDTSWLISSSVSNFWDGKRKFDMAASQAREQFGVTIGPRRVRGQGVKDMFQLDGYPVGRLTFSMFTAYNPNARIPGSGDGYLGLGYPDIERTIPDHNVLDVMMANGMIDYKRFTLFCVCATHRNNLEPDARIVFGSHGTINPQEFHMVPLENAHGGWRVHVERRRHKEGHAVLAQSFQIQKFSVVA